jgi:AraC-like DNA-binding protein
LPDSGKGFRSCIFQVNPHECVETKPAIDRGADGFTVADVAMRWGLMHTGRFAAAYRRTYGESPSETLRGHRVIPK